MYLEGSDQHRGWFQSSLLVALATRGRPPYRQVLTHGFLIDLEGRKMSKSVGNTIVPQEVIKESGAEIIRLWVAMTEFTEELRVSKEILTRVVDFYRKLRNTSRILVANLYDFDPATDMVPVERMDEVDRYALARYADAARRMLKAYDEFDFSTVVAGAQHAGDRRSERVLRGRDEGPDVHAGRAVARAALDADGDVPHLRRARAPARADPAGDGRRPVAASARARIPSRCTSRPSRRSIASRTRRCAERWDALSKVREQVNAALEQKRKDKVIGNSLTAHVTVTAQGGVGRLLEQYRRELPMLFIVSDFELNVGAGRRRGRVTRRGGQGARSEVRALLALRAEHPAGARLGGPVRPLRGRAGGTGAPVAAVRTTRLFVPAGHRRCHRGARSDHEAPDPPSNSSSTTARSSSRTSSA